jgi:hypothetical protein
MWLYILHFMHQAEVHDMGLWAARADEEVVLKNIYSTFFAPKLSFGTHDYPYCLNILWPSIKHSFSQIQVSTYRNTIGYSNPSHRCEWNLPPYVQVSEILCPLPIHCGHSHYSSSLQAGWSGDWIPVRARFSTAARTGPRAHPVSCTMGTGSFSQG